MNKLFLLLGALLVLLSVAVSVPSATAQGFDWTYEYELTSHDYCFETVIGGWEASIGLTSDPAPTEDEPNRYVLAANVTMPYDVFPARVEFSGGPMFPFGETIHYYGIFTAFGLETTYDVTQLDSEDIGVALNPAAIGVHGNAINFYLEADDMPGGFIINQILVYGNGVRPIEVDCAYFPTPTPTNTPTPTPIPPSATPSNTRTPSNTPTPSRTPTATATPTDEPWSCYFDFTFDEYEDYWEAVDHGGNPGAVYVPLVGWQQAPLSEGSKDYIDIGLIGGAISDETYPTHFTHIEFDVTQTGGIDFENGWRIYAGWIEPTFSEPATWEWEGDRTLYEFGMGTPGNEPLSFLGYSPIFVDGTWLIESALIEGYGVNTVCEDFPPPTPTPTNTITPSRTPNPSGTVTLTPILPPSTPPTATRTPPPTSTRYIITVYPSYTMPPLGTFPPTTTPFPTSTRLATTTPMATATTGTPFYTATFPSEPWATSMPVGGGEGLGEGSGCDNSGLVTQICAVIAFASNGMNQAFRWIETTTERAGAIVAAYQEAEPEPIPGLPHCGTDRFASELCAIYYILTWTIFSGPIGQLIIPMAVIDVDLLILFTFIQLARAILARLAGMLKQ